MKTKIIFLMLICVMEMMAQDSIPNKSHSSWAAIYPRGFVPLPDSLGGKKATGDVTMILYLSRHGEVLGYEVVMIRVATDPCKRREIYRIGAPTLAVAKRKGTIVGQEVLDRFGKWIDENYQKLDIKIDTTHEIFKTSDTVLTVYIFDINPMVEDKDALDSIIVDYTMPKFTLPHKLGGKKVKGNICVRLLINSEGEIECWFPAIIDIWKRSRKGTEYLWSYSDGSPYQEGEEEIIKKFSPWIGACLKEAKFEINKEHRIWKGMESIPIPICVEVNSKKVFHKADPVCW
ncbi:MAG TPA: hypothetical protein PK595_01860 [Bacteroidota bacterium]|nr:hypothetical protein [Bacteroidota bacterium]